MGAWTNGTYTKKGLSLLSKLTQGNSLHITRVVAGTGYVTQTVLANQTAVSGIKQELSLKAASYPDVGVCKLPMFLTNKGVASGYKARQIGVYANDPDDGEILYFISQSETGTEVPSEASMPEYSATWTFTFRYGQADDVSITVDPSHTVTEDMLNEVRDIAEMGIAPANSGTMAVCKNTANLPMANIKLFGKTMQNGTPTPDFPVDLVNVGNSGTIAVNVYGKNLCNMAAFNSMGLNASANTYDASTHTITMTEDSTGYSGRYGAPFKYCEIGKQYTVSFDIRGTAGKLVSCGWDGGRVSITLTESYRRHSATITATRANMAVVFYTVRTTDGGLAAGEWMQFDNVQIECGSHATEFEVYKSAQSLPVTTEGGLPGIPVASGGNYTDADGQQWICDEIDFARGVKVQRVRKMTMDSGDFIQYSLSSSTGRGQLIVSPNDAYKKNKSIAGVMCNVATKNPVPLEATNGEFYVNPSNFVLVGEKGESEESILAKYATLEMLYILATPIETPLTGGEISAFESLISHNPITTAVNDAGADMEVDCFLKQHESAIYRILHRIESRFNHLDAIYDELSERVDNMANS